MKTLILLFFLASCASPLIVKSQRVLKFSENVQVSKEEIYVASMQYLAMNVGNSNSAIRYNSPSQGTIIVKGNLICNELRQFGDVNDYNVNFTLTVRAKNNRAALIFNDVYMSHANGNPTSWSYNQISSKEKLEEVSPCLETIKDEIINGI